MKRYLYTAVLAVLLAMLLSGCGFWMDGDHLSVTPHQDQSVQITPEVIEVSNYTELRKALVEMVETGAQGGILSASSFNNATIHFYVDIAINHILKNTPIGAYAVNQITYEVGTNRGEAVIAFDIEYNHSSTEILRIKKTSSMEEATVVITAALDDCDASVVVRVDQYEAVDITQLVQDYANNNPDIVMEMPQVSVSVYPERGAERVISLTFTYQTSREKLRQMQEQVAPVFTSAELYVKETAQVRDIYSRLYAFLMERNDYTLETSITPSYSLLHHGVGDSRAFANVYAAMCRRADLDCQVVSGTRAGEPWCWNVVRFRGAYYYVDLLQCSQSGGFRMLGPDEMTGYVWDYSAFPAD